MKKRWLALAAVITLSGGLLVPPAVLMGTSLLAIGFETGGLGEAGCIPATDDLGTVPGPSDTGGEITLTPEQETVIAMIGAVATDLGLSQQAVEVALLTGLQESNLRMLANSSVPTSLDYPHDGVGSDHDSLNVFQQRPSSGWGSVEELMDLQYAVQAFFGGPEGPNAGSPAGLLDIDGWESMDPGEAAQAVQVSAHPDRYARWTPTVDAILAVATDACGPTAPVVDGDWVQPAHAMVTSRFGNRGRICGGGGCTPSSHSGTDLGVPIGTPVGAAAAGTVVYAQSQFEGGWVIIIAHGDGISTLYAHLLPGSFRVDVGDTVDVGETIALSGNSGAWTTGAHLHFSVMVDGTFVDPEPFMQERGVPLGQ